MQSENPEQAFDHAVDCGVLSASRTAPNYAGKYMYMYTDHRLVEIADGTVGVRDERYIDIACRVDHFKHIDTRKYVECVYCDEGGGPSDHHDCDTGYVIA